MLYSYICNQCGREAVDDNFSPLGQPLARRCVCGGVLRRSVGRVSIARSGDFGFEPHFNDAVGAPVTSMRDFREQLAAKARANTEATGIEHHYTPVDPRDRDAFGIRPTDVEMNEAVNRGVRLDKPASTDDTSEAEWGEPEPLVGEKT